MNDRPFAHILDPFYYAAQPLLNVLSDALAACNASQDLRHHIILQAQLLAVTIVLTNKVEREALLAELDDLPDTVAHWARYLLLHGADHHPQYVARRPASVGRGALREQRSASTRF